MYLAADETEHVGRMPSPLQYLAEQTRWAIEASGWGELGGVLGLAFGGLRQRPAPSLSACGSGLSSPVTISVMLTMQLPA